MELKEKPARTFAAIVVQGWSTRQRLREKNLILANSSADQRGLRRQGNTLLQCMVEDQGVLNWSISDGKDNQGTGTSCLCGNCS